MAQDIDQHHQERRQQQQLPVDADGVCMVCKQKPAEESTLVCITCATPWHLACLATVPETMASALQFECPDCTGSGIDGVAAAPAAEGAELVAKVKEIEADASLSEREKAIKRQKLMSGEVDEGSDEKAKEKMITDEGDDEEHGNDVLKMLGESFKCAFCMQLPERPVSTPCGHNFCLKCFEKWIKQGKRTCTNCRSSIPSKMAIQPRINSALVLAIRMAKLSQSATTRVPQTVYQVLNNQDRPDKPFTTDRAKRGGISNAARGRRMVTVPEHHFGPIPAENDPERNLGVLVGERWTNRLECSQWGVHRPPVAGIAGQARIGAQSVVLSGGYEDDEDHGEWFLYTGSGGRDLSGNKRTNKEQSFDQDFASFNEALRVSCNMGYPVRVVRSENEKRSSYAPTEGYRYDGIYRIEKCWRKVGKQGFKVCRYLFVRCDNEPAPWTSDESGDKPRPFPAIPELKNAIDISERIQSPAWDYEEEEGCWKWKKPPPPCKEPVVKMTQEDRENARKVIRNAQRTSVKDVVLKGFSCLLCKKVLNLPLTTPCAHNFCKPCLEAKFSGQTFTKERVCNNGRRLRSQKNIMACPSCQTDISEFLQNPQVNRELLEVIEKLKAEINEGKSDDSATGQDKASELGSDALPVSSGSNSSSAGAESIPENATDTGCLTTNEEEKTSPNESVSRKRASDCSSLDAPEAKRYEKLEANAAGLA